MYESFKKAIMRELKSEFNNHTIYGEGIEQGFKRPSFFVAVIPVTNEFTNKNRRERGTMFDIVYFSKRETNEENLKMMDTLCNMFSTINVGERTFICKKQRFTIVDGLLHYMFDIDLIEFDNTEQCEIAREININKGVI